ncbi:CinA family nicotinamide mononucleotide deamidase-related protein [Vibrio ruber]|uniref:CinA family nicotinamide mononucleotide deamidase-related protein n=1 Tax=Vibrio ruber TaxID=184755 RepID=UPI0028934B36|nr:CinA family nicotinamide mononucleotide deamidase-related protein [Vibrio ruber]WNJ95252.1 CinA family nicotinamide mononucleotide deamidase-related protein [Vibrio ruber]
MLKVAMLSTGEEVLHGDIQDTNAAWLSSLFFEQGYPLTKRSTAGDNRQVLRDEILMLALNSDVLIVNGGLGPTSDDLSAEVAAEAAEQQLTLFPDWLEKMKARFAQRNLVMSDSNIKQAMLPEHATLLDNPVGTACGFKVEIHGCLCYFTPGVPSEFQKMISEQVLPDLNRQFPDVSDLACHRLYTLGSSESVLEDLLQQVELPDEYQLGFRAYLPFIEVKLFGPAGQDNEMYRLMEEIFTHVSEWTVSIDQPMLAQLSQVMHESGKTLAIAEQSTRGWLVDWLFSDDAIFEQCGSSWVLSPKVSEKMSAQDPVSAVLALASATKEKSETELALVTGEFREDGFTLALSSSEGEWAQQLKFKRDYRADERKILIGTIAADMLLRYLSSKPVFGKYSSTLSEKQIYIPATSL